MSPIEFFAGANTSGVLREPDQQPAETKEHAGCANAFEKTSPWMPLKLENSLNAF